MLLNLELKLKRISRYPHNKLSDSIVSCRGSTRQGIVPVLSNTASLIFPAMLIELGSVTLIPFCFNRLMAYVTAILRARGRDGAMAIVTCQ